jgi:group I intron endonuclease
MSIYKILNKVTGKVYIGQTKSKSTIRWNCHKRNLRKGKHYNNHLQSAWIKYGEDSFIFEVIDCSTNLEELNNLEVYWIEFYNSTNREKGYNLESGGGANKIVSDETRLKMSKNGSSEKNLSRITKIGIGKVLSEEHKAALVKANTGRICSDETRAKIAKSNTGKKHSEETKVKQSERKKGKKGNPHTEESKKKLSEAHKGRKFSEEHKLKLSQARRNRSAKVK